MLFQGIEKLGERKPEVKPEDKKPDESYRNLQSELDKARNTNAAIVEAFGGIENLKAIAGVVKEKGVTHIVSPKEPLQRPKRPAHDAGEAAWSEYDAAMDKYSQDQIDERATAIAAKAAGAGVGAIRQEERMSKFKTRLGNDFDDFKAFLDNPQLTDDDIVLAYLAKNGKLNQEDFNPNPPNPLDFLGAGDSISADGEVNSKKLMEQIKQAKSPFRGVEHFTS